MKQSKMRIALYLRVSTNVQETERQRTDLTKKAKENKAEIVFEFEDKISGFKNETKRPNLKKLLQLTKDDIDAVYVSELSRLSRDPTHFTELVGIFKKKGINIYFLSQNLNTINDDDNKDLVADISLAFFSRYSAYEIKLKNERSASGKKQAIIIKGNSYSYKPPFGYMKVDKKLCLNEDEAKVVKEIYERYAKGESIKEIVGYLNLKKIPTRNSDFIKKESFQVNSKKTMNKIDIKWGKSSVRNILRNTVYCGSKIIKGGETVNTPVIVTEELFAKCQDEIKGRITNTDKSLINDFMLRGFFICGECGKQFIGTRSHSNLLYKCSDKTHLKSNSYLGCKNTSIFKVHVEEMIWTSVKGAYIQLRTKQIKDTSISTLESNIVEYNSQINAIDKELSKLMEKSDRLRELYLNGSYPIDSLNKNQKYINAETESFTKRRKKLKALLSDALSGLIAIKKMNSNPFKLEEIDQSYELQKKAVKELVKEVLIFKVDNKYSVFQINFKASYSIYIIRETWTKKFHIADGNIFSFDPKSLIFTTNTGMDENYTANLQISSKSIQYQPKELFDEMERQEKIEDSDEFKEMVEKINMESSDQLKALEII